MSSTSKIFLEPRSLLPHLEEIRAQGLTIVTANGCFELIHKGHIDYLSAAKALGDVLIVLVNTDESMRLIKPDRRPVNPDRDRFAIIAAFQAVDYVVPLRESTPVSLLEVIRPHIHTKGTDYTLERIPEREVVERYGGRVELVGGPKSRSTSEMLRGIQEPRLLS